MPRRHAYTSYADDLHKMDELERAYQRDYEQKIKESNERLSNLNLLMDRSIRVYHNILDNRINFDILSKCSFPTFFDFIQNPHKFEHDFYKTLHWRTENHIELKDHFKVIKTISRASRNNWIMFAHSVSQL